MGGGEKGVGGGGTNRSRSQAAGGGFRRGGGGEAEEAAGREAGGRRQHGGVARRGRRRERVVVEVSACGRLAKPARLEKKRPVSLCASLRHERYGLDGPDPAFRSSCYLGLKFTGRVVRFYKLLNRSCLVRNVKVRPRNR